MKTLVIGLGNPLLRDDGVGIRVARLVGETVGGRPDLTVTEVYAGGLRLMDALEGYDRAIIVDAMVTGEHEPGTVRSSAAPDLLTTRNLACSHDTSLTAALELGRALGLRLPRLEDIRIVGIEALALDDFGETLTSEVDAAVPVAARQIIEEIAGRQA